MKFKLGMKEINELMVDGEFIIDDEDIQRKEMEIFENEDIIRLKTELDIISSGEMPEFSLYKKVNNVFKDIELSKKTQKITNLDEIGKNWDEVKNEILYDYSTPIHIIDNLLSMSNYYEDEILLESILENYNLIPFFRNINFKDIESNDGIEKELNIYGLLAVGTITYKIKNYVKKEYENGKDKYEIIFTGKGSVPSADSSLETSAKNIMKTPDKGIYYVYTDIKGKFIYSNYFERLVINISFSVEQVKDLKRYDYSRKKILIDLSKEGVE